MTSGVTVGVAWPEPYFQPDATRDCAFYATAYLARCLGHPDVTAQDVMAWREMTTRHEDYYIEQALGIESRSWWHDKLDDGKRRHWWLGPDGREWVESWLNDGWIGGAHVHRISAMTHAVAVLGVSDAGLLLMDPILGHIVEPWDWFLGLGAGTFGCHRITAWHRVKP